MAPARTVTEVFDTRDHKTQSSFTQNLRLESALAVARSCETIDWRTAKCTSSSTLQLLGGAAAAKLLQAASTYNSIHLQLLGGAAALSTYNSIHQNGASRPLWTNGL